MITPYIPSTRPIEIVDPQLCTPSLGDLCVDEFTRFIPMIDLVICFQMPRIGGCDADLVKDRFAAVIMS